MERETENNIYMDIKFALFLIAVLLWLLWLLVKREKEIHAKEQQARRSMQLIEIQQSLFSVYKNPACIADALLKLRNMQGCENTFLILLNHDIVKEVYVGAEHEKKRVEALCGRDIQELAPHISSALKKGEHVLLDQNHMDGAAYQEDAELLHIFRIHSLMLVPLQAGKKELLGILGAMNLSRISDADMNFLSEIIKDFFMTISNLEAYRMIQKLGMTDALTGLNNRSSYQSFLMKYPELPDSTIGCIYMDVNGLHELNNHLGHDAGDKMLIQIAELLNTVFYHNHIYRIGGDEFIIFGFGQEEAELQQDIAVFREKLEAQGYQASIGFAWQTSIHNLEDLVEQAEHRMYENKQYYYQHDGKKKARLLDQKVEKIMQEKRDADIFLSIISPYFMGVYVVDLITDKTRIIYLPSYFNAMLRAANYKFRQAFGNYIESFVEQAEKDKLYQTLNYRELEEQLCQQDTLEYTYHKTDGSRLGLRICKSDDYRADKKETFWIFETYNKR